MSPRVSKIIASGGEYFQSISTGWAKMQRLELKSKVQLWNTHPDKDLQKGFRDHDKN